MCPLWIIWNLIPPIYIQTSLCLEYYFSIILSSFRFMNLFIITYMIMLLNFIFHYLEWKSIGNSACNRLTGNSFHDMAFECSFRCLLFSWNKHAKITFRLIRDNKIAGVRLLILLLSLVCLIRLVTSIQFYNKISLIQQKLHCNPIVNLSGLRFKHICDLL